MPSFRPARARFDALLDSYRQADGIEYDNDGTDPTILICQRPRGRARCGPRD
jgi:hypothetical protein